MNGLQVLPRARFWESGVGCADHGDPTCLCDVVFSEPAPMLATEHKFHTIALHELDDDTVSERNLHEFFSVVMGLFELENALQAQDSPVRRESFTALPEQIAAALHNHARADSPWPIASIELDGLGLPESQIKKLRHDYNNIAGGIRDKRRRRGTPKPRPVTVTEPKVKVLTAEQRAVKNAAVRAGRARRKTGQSWHQAKVNGPTIVPDTYALEEL